jgi:hypothetical protein
MAQDPNWPGGELVRIAWNLRLEACCARSDVVQASERERDDFGPCLSAAAAGVLAMQFTSEAPDTLDVAGHNESMEAVDCHERPAVIPHRPYARTSIRGVTPIATVPLLRLNGRFAGEPRDRVARANLLRS